MKDISTDTWSAQDEASASVDFQTDAKLQAAFRSDALADSMVLIIAHRLATVINSDRILVLGAGKVLEYDSPAALLKKKDSAFRALCLVSLISLSCISHHLTLPCKSKRQTEKISLLQLASLRC